MQTILKKYSQRIKLAKQISQEIKEQEFGTITLNDKYTINYEEFIISFFQFNGRNYYIDENTFKFILNIKDVKLSIELEEIYKICEMVNKHG